MRTGRAVPPAVPRRVTPADVAADAVDAELQTIADGLTLAVRSGAMTPARAYALGLAAAAVRRVRTDWRAEQNQGTTT
jgi:hypothetical protein